MKQQQQNIERGQAAHFAGSHISTSHAPHEKNNNSSTSWSHTKNIPSEGAERRRQGHCMPPTLLIEQQQPQVTLLKGRLPSLSLPALFSVAVALMNTQHSWGGVVAEPRRADSRACKWGWVMREERPRVTLPSLAQHGVTIVQQGEEAALKATRASAQHKENTDELLLGWLLGQLQLKQLNGSLDKNLKDNKWIKGEKNCTKVKLRWSLTKDVSLGSHRNYALRWIT